VPSGDQSKLTWHGNGGNEGEDEEARQHEEHKERLLGATLHSACSLVGRAVGVSHSHGLRTRYGARNYETGMG
jgi:hypothetical protein